MSRLLLVTTLALGFLVAGVAHAAKVRVWHHHAPAHYDKARLEHAVISNEGALRLSRQVKALAAVQAMHVWDLVEDRDGNLFVATGDEGKLFKVAPDGTTSVVFTSEDSQVLCLATAPDGTIHAGTGPSGTILRITPDGKGQVLWQGSENYVWCLAYDARQQTLYAGTGPHGRIYRVTADGKVSLYYTTKQEHILSLAVGPGGTLYAGTGKGGLVYRIDTNGKGFVLFSAPQAEVRSLLVANDGIYAATSSPTRRRGGGGSQSSAGTSPLLSASSSALPVSSNQPQPGRQPTAESSSERDKDSANASPEAAKANAAAAPQPPVTGDNCVYRIAPDGTVREIFREKALLLSLLRQDGRLFVGTGMEGQLFEVDETSKERAEVARLDHGQIHCLCRRRDGSVVLGTGDPGKLYVLQDKYAPQGMVVSEVLDAKLISKWGSLRWQGGTPRGTAITVAVRSGNVAEPDETWSDWSAEQNDPQQAVLVAPAARFLQYRVTLATEDPAVTPTLHSLALRYMTANQAPEVGVIEVPNLDAANLDNPKKLRFKWTATDANEDDLTYSLYVRKEGWKSWIELEESWEKKEYEWDTTTTPSGIYQLKVVASDRKDNPAEDAQTGERISAPFAVSHTPPAVTVRVVSIDDDKASIEATAVDTLVRLTAASFAVNGRKWINVFPADGLFDSRNETFRFKTESLKPGTYVAVLRVRDAAGNTGSGDVVFTVPGKAAEER